MKVTANATRSGGWWAVEVPDVLGGIHTQARRLDQIPAVVADALSMVDITVDEVTVVPTYDEDVRRATEEAKSASENLVAAQARAQQASRAAVAAIMSAGMTVRDAASLLGISPQRVSQLARS